ncbi:MULTISPECIES: hypothetical protein [Hyphomonas]|uniref:Uncharacterized protein n=1 Tax=Hyphomonas atlantica TaxID=1280948 RepID=A0A059DYI2_9PROT|nr:MULTISPECIES: hypothetical protein [Hyphomonas]KCZ58625.1 hypothetical protein HY36_09610 [Hyphomonas atlantica]MAM06769.1 hypothetical protein [Hyphomonas sp.]
MPSDIAVEFAPAEESIEWANRAIAELGDQISKFFSGGVAEVVTHTNADTSQNVQKLKLTTDIPKDFRRKATEALNNARHSFDQSVFAARNILATKSNKGINYPWARDPDDLDQLLDRRKIDSRLWDTIKSHEPYRTSDKYSGGNDLIRLLATIANNKHTVGLTVDAVIARTRYPTITGGPIQKLEVLRPVWNARTKEAELIRWIGEAKIEGEYEFNLLMCLKDSRLPQPVSAVDALSDFTKHATDVCESIKAKCVELTQ